MRNRVKVRDFPALLLKIHRERISGLLLVDNHTAKHGLFFLDGRLIHAITNRDDLKLEQFIRDKGLVDGGECPAPNEAKIGKQHPGLILVNSGMVTDARMHQIMNLLATEIVMTTFRLPEFKVRFERKPYKPAFSWHASLYIPNLIIKGIRITEGWDGILRDLKRGKLRVKLSPGALEDFRHLDLNAEEGFLLSRIYGEMNLSEVLTLSHLDEEMTLRSIYAMLAAGVIERCARRVMPAFAVGAQDGSIRQVPYDLDLINDLEALCGTVLENSQGEPGVERVTSAPVAEQPAPLVTDSPAEAPPEVPQPAADEPARETAAGVHAHSPFDAPAQPDQAWPEPIEASRDRQDDTAKDYPAGVRDVRYDDEVAEEAAFEACAMVESDESSAAQAEAPEQERRIIILGPSSQVEEKPGTQLSDDTIRFVHGDDLFELDSEVAAAADAENASGPGESSESVFGSAPDGVMAVSAKRKADKTQSRRHYESMRLRVISTRNDLTCDEIRSAFTNG